MKFWLQENVEYLATDFGKIMQQIVPDNLLPCPTGWYLLRQWMGLEILNGLYTIGFGQRDHLEALVVQNIYMGFNSAVSLRPKFLQVDAHEMLVELTRKNNVNDNDVIVI